MIRRGLPIVLIAFAPVAAWAQFVPDSPPEAPSAAEGSGVGPYYTQARETRRDIEHARDAGQMTKRQAKAFNKDSRRNDAAAGRYARDGLTASEARELDMRGRALDSIVNSARARQNAR